MVCRCACGLVGFFLLGASVIAAEDPQPPLIKLTLRLQLQPGVDLSAERVKYGVFPEGKRCAFTYFGVGAARTVEVLSKLGFRTTIYCRPDTSPQRLKALEAAGGDIGISIWGGKGTYSSHIGANTIQEAFDAVVTSRLVLAKSCAGPLACGAIGGHYGTKSFPIDRDPDNRSGFGYAYHDANYLLLSDNKPYMVYLGRQGKQLLANRANFDNRIRPQRVPNETIYYQILANQFRGTLRRAEKGQIVRFSLRDFKAPDLTECAEVIGPFGRHEDIWHATEAEIGANEYIRRKVRVLEVKHAGRDAEIVLGVEQDAFAPFLLTPLPLQLPKRLGIRAAEIGGVACKVTVREDAACVDVPLRAALRNGCRMSLKPAEPDMTVPDRMRLTLTVRNTTDEPLTDARLRWVGNIGLTVTGEDAASGAPFELPGNSHREFRAVAVTGKSARFGITPIQAVLTGDMNGRQRTFMEGFELVVAPRLRVEVDPMQRIPMPQGRSQHFLIHIDNKASTRPGGPPNTFISHKAGPCKGTVSLDLPAHMTATPSEQPFELAENQRKTLVFKVRNDGWSEEPGRVRPVIRFAGKAEPVSVVFPGTTVIRAKSKIYYQPLDATGLLVQASWDDNTQNGHFDRSCGNPAAHFFPGHYAAYNNEGVKGWCMNSQRVCQIHDSFKNIDHQAGTVCLWLRKDPFVRNENTYVPVPEETAKMLCGRSNRGETIFTAGCVQNVSSSNSGITLRRFRSWEGKEGYLQLTYQLMGHRVICCQARPFVWTEKWRHVAMLWSVPDRRLELYVDGKLAAKADPGAGEWHTCPWDRAGPSGWNLIAISSDHGLWCGTCRDELYIYNRALTPAEIMANKNLSQ